MDLLSKTHDIPDDDFPAVIEDRFSRQMSKNLMLIRYDDLVIKTGCPVQHRFKRHFKSAVRRRKLPRIHVSAFRNMKDHIIQLMGFSVPEEDILRRRARVAKTISDIPSEGMTVHISIP